jgi:hypothetical protein
VKLLRIWLLVLLAVLLPVRGALAAAMVCAPANGAPSSMSAHAEHDNHYGHGDGGHEHATGDHGSDAGSGHGDKTDKCNLCSASCSATPLLHEMPGIAEPYGLTAAAYPDVAAAAPSFLSDGQERPPRSI